MGYTKVDVTAGLNLLGSQFVNVGNAETLDISALVQSADLAGLDEEFMFQSELLVWTGLGYATYGWCADGQGDELEVPEWNAQWLLNDMSDLANVGIPAGDGFWINTTAPATITLAGEVLAGDTYEVSVQAGLNLIANPFPTAISIQGVQSADLAGLDEEFMFQSELLVWTGLGYATYGWCADGQGDELEVPEWNAQWLLNDMSDLADVTIGVGQAFWINTTAPATITFTK